MRDIYLRFSNESEMLQQLIKSGFEECKSELYLRGVCLDVIGIIYSQINPGAEIPEYQADEGWHVNMRIIDDRITLPELNLFIVNPKTPARVWA